jgi:hypothetical protein
MCRQRVEWDQCVGWHLNQFHREYTVRNPTCGHLQSSVSVCVCFLSHYSLLNAFLCFVIVCLCYLYFVFVCWLTDVLLLLVYEIVSQSEPHKGKDVFDVAMQIRCVLCVVILREWDEWNEFHLHIHISFSLVWYSDTHAIVLTIDLWLTHYVDYWLLIHNTTHTFYRDEGLTPEIPRECPEKLAQLMKMCWNKDPNQRPVSPLSISSQSSQIMFVLICETQTHTHTHILKRCEMSLSLVFIVDCCVPWFETYINTQIERTLKRFVKCCNSETHTFLAVNFFHLGNVISKNNSFENKQYISCEESVSILFLLTFHKWKFPIVLIRSQMIRTSV